VRKSKYPRPSPKMLRSQLYYDKDTGLLWWKCSGTGRDITKPAGTTLRGYVRIWFGHMQYQAHVLAWVIVKGRWPKKEIDHRDTVRNNNQWNNLRLATHGQNQANGRRYKNNKSGLKGVTAERGGKWRASIQARKTLYYLGLYETKEQASAAYIAAAEKLHKEFARF
jgi:hypothetical protein